MLLRLASHTNGRFGTVALILQLIPIFSMFFLMSTAVGAALWAVEIENRRPLLGGRTDRGELYRESNNTLA
jgi:hypothetical protein